MIALPFRGNSTEQGNRTAGISWSPIEGNRKPCSSRGTIPATSTCWKTACQEKKKKNKLAMTQYVAKKDNNFLTCTAGRSREVILSLYPILRRHSRSAVSSAVLPERRKRKAYSSKLSKGPWRWVRAWSIWHMKRVWKKVHYSARKKEGSGIVCFFFCICMYTWLEGRRSKTVFS